MQTIRCFVTLFLAWCALPICAAPFEVKIHDELIASHQEYSFEAEIKLYKPPLGGAITSSVVQSRFELAKGISPTLVLDTHSKTSTYSVGIGKGIHVVGDRWVVKLIGAIPLNF